MAQLQSAYVLKRTWQESTKKKLARKSRWNSLGRWMRNQSKHFEWNFFKGAPEIILPRERKMRRQDSGVREGWEESFFLKKFFEVAWVVYLHLWFFILCKQKPSQSGLLEFNAEFLRSFVKADFSKFSGRKVSREVGKVDPFFLIGVVWILHFIWLR